MQMLVAIGVGSAGCGAFQNSQALNCCSLACLVAGALLIGAALWHLSKAPGENYSNLE